MAKLNGYSDIRLAAILFVAGWTLFWAAALDLISFVPLWLALGVALAGLSMLPLSMRRSGGTPLPTAIQRPADL